MAVSSEIGSITNLVGEEKAVRLLGEAGFEHWDFSLFAMRGKYDRSQNDVIFTGHPLEIPGECLKLARRLKEIGEAYGMTCNQSHAPFPLSCKAILDRMKRAIECTAEAGGDVCVIHPDNDRTREENLEIFQSLLPFAKEHSVRLAAENLYDHSMKPASCGTPEDFLAYMEGINDPSFVACLDIGHAEMQSLHTSAVAMIHTLGSHLAAIHLHDNDLVRDSHQIPFTMSIDYAPIAKALKEVGYPGVFTLEADRFMDGYGSDPAEGVRKLAESARRFEKMVRDA